MPGTWTEQNKILPGAYLNFLTNVPLSITPGSRGIAVILQEVSVGVAGEVYTVTIDKNNYPEGASEADKLLAYEALKGAQQVLIYNLGTAHDAADIETALAALKTVKFDTLCYPYSGTNYEANKTAIETWVDSMRNDEGVKVQAVLADYVADNEGVINVAHSIKLSDGTVLTVAQVTAWVAGITAGATVYQSNTGKIYEGAIDVVPRMTKTEMETALTAGKFIFKVDNAQNVSVVYDINSLTSATDTKSKLFRKNRAIRTIDGINNDIVSIFESNHKGKTNNNETGRSLFRADLVEYFNSLQSLSAIINFTPEDVTVDAGTDNDAVVVNIYIQTVDSIEKVYMSVNLS